ncbi:MAG TPA: zinc metalloprotease HtpX [Abditibacteriaceae bacterium]|nr:zinc metalloprotease HtpX [Abditibacteriaceae bacterium]
MKPFATYNNLKTFVLLAGLTALVAGAGRMLGGPNGLIIGLGLAFVMNFVAYWFSDKIALAMSGAKEVSPQEAPDLHAMVGDLARRANLPMPRVYVIPQAAPNAFATGRDPKHSAVAVTQGIVQMLNRDELEGVIAHELAHIKHRDILISSVAAMMAGALTQLAHMFQWGLIFGGFGGRDDEDNGAAGLVGGLLLMIVAPIAAMMIQMAISRSREYEADRGGAEICGRPASLANALLKLEAGAQRIPMHADPATAHMYIVSPLSGQALAGLFSTHPATAERVARLEALSRQPEFAPSALTTWR